MIAAERKTAELAFRPPHRAIRAHYLAEKIFFHLVLTANVIDITQVNGEVRPELPNAVGHHLRLVGSGGPIAGQTESGSIRDRENASTLAGSGVIAERVLFVKPIADHMRNPSQEVAGQECVQRTVGGFRVVGTAGANMRSEAGVQHPVEV